MKIETHIPLLLSGRSGSGKSTVANLISYATGRSVVASYTTRPMRPGEINGVGHIFVTDEEFDCIVATHRLIAFTEFNGYRYCATQEQLNENSIYIIDKNGLETMPEDYRKRCFSVNLAVTRATCIDRMRQRGDTEEMIQSRLKNDDTAFRGIEDYADVIVDANGSAKSVAGEIIHLLDTVQINLNKTLTTF